MLFRKLNNIYIYTCILLPSSSWLSFFYFFLFCLLNFIYKKRYYTSIPIIFLIYLSRLSYYSWAILVKVLLDLLFVNLIQIVYMNYHFEYIQLSIWVSFFLIWLTTRSKNLRITAQNDNFDDILKKSLFFVNNYIFLFSFFNSSFTFEIST